MGLLGRTHADGAWTPGWGVCHGKLLQGMDRECVWASESSLEREREEMGLDKGPGSSEITGGHCRAKGPDERERLTVHA